MRRFAKTFFPLLLALAFAHADNTVDHLRPPPKPMFRPLDSSSTQTWTDLDFEFDAKISWEMQQCFNIRRAKRIDSQLQNPFLESMKTLFLNDGGSAKAYTTYQNVAAQNQALIKKDAESGKQEPPNPFKLAVLAYMKWKKMPSEKIEAYRKAADIPDAIAVKAVFNLDLDKWQTQIFKADKDGIFKKLAKIQSTEDAEYKQDKKTGYQGPQKTEEGLTDSSRYVQFMQDRINYWAQYWFDRESDAHDLRQSMDQIFDLKRKGVSVRSEEDKLIADPRFGLTKASLDKYFKDHDSADLYKSADYIFASPILTDEYDFASDYVGKLMGAYGIPKAKIVEKTRKING